VHHAVVDGDEHVTIIEVGVVMQSELNAISQFCIGRGIGIRRGGCSHAAKDQTSTEKYPTGTEV
jgi:hypothetical protein